MIFFKLVKADFMKMKNTPFYKIHIILPALAAFIFLSDVYAVRKDTTAAASRGIYFLETLLIVFPVIIGIITSMVMDNEAKAGKFREMLCTKNSRSMTLLSKLTMMCVMGLFSYIFSAAIFFTGYICIMHSQLLSIYCIIKIIVITFIPIVSLYVIHSMLSIRFGMGADIGWGIFELLFSAVFLTGLGDKTWFFFPCSQPSRLYETIVVLDENFKYDRSFVYQYRFGTVCSLIIMILAGAAGILWFNFFEGRSEKS